MDRKLRIVWCKIKNCKSRHWRNCTSAPRKLSFHS